MVTDRQQLTASGGITGRGARISAAFGLAVLSPILIWVYATAPQTLGTAHDGSAFVLNTVRMLCVVLAISIPISLPWFASSPDWGSTLFGPLMVVLVPLPLVTVLWLTGDLSLSGLLLPFVGIALFMIGVTALMRSLLFARLEASTLALVQTSITVIIASVAWALRDTWLAWFGL